MRWCFLLAFFVLASCSSKPVEAPTPRRPVRITQFYASPPDPEPGAKTMLCYGVENATVVRLDPPVERVWPAVARCFEVAANAPRVYTLTAERGEDRVSTTLTIRKGAPRVEILEVRVDALEIDAGGTMHVCYKARNAGSVTVTPGTWRPDHTPDYGCVSYVQNQTTTYTVLARDADGDIIDGEEVTVRVK
jgi:hypothetical protein